MHFFIIALSFMLTFQSCHGQPRQKQSTFTMNTNQNLLKAVQNNDTATVIKALEQGADVNHTDEQGRSLLLIATVNKHTEMATLLVKRGADVNLQAHNKDSAFLYAGASGQTALLQLFIAHGARFDLFNRYNGTALIPACERGHIETVRLLANTKGFPIDHVNRLGWTALMEAVILGDGNSKYQQIVQILKDAGANMHIPDHDGVTPLQHARKRGFTEIVNIIQ